MKDTFFSSKSVVVTGATRGIGAAIAEAFQAKGLRVIGTGTHHNAKDNFDQYIQADFSDLAQIYKCAELIKYLEPDILINNAGICINSPFIDIDPVIFQKIQQVNLFAPFLLSQSVIPNMKKNGWGRIVNISSVWGKVSKQYRASYSASKFALDGLNVSLAAEHAKDGILANCVAPGFTDTDLTRSALSENEIDEITKTVPIGRLANTKEIADLVVWLSSPANSYISGQSIYIDGGFSRV